ncbi:response regulator receiver domain-containing protein [Stenotrophomonas rhizophila]|jgi:CheY-like chemotaxis protein|uniref:CheY-like chemotaxis protein n=1 Tax=Stenotrophomonas rhizophila TaxID=216778 RepID=A0AAW5PGZ7_9GAMM|nr:MULTISPECIES: response regulator [Stenotrophomonas]MCS4278973.1 CheY-like chemotaxis protein [Stenotrophomonas rhizophila]MCW6027027.1 response regulator [Stenotrophomonas sp. SRS1]ROP80522.1 response regulator receiver domain-containing protein [Stenotrophomonas rhizophila]
MSALQDLRVLVVENDEMSAALLQMQLVQSGAIVVGLAASVGEALRLLGETQPQVALLDYRLANNETSEPVAQALAARQIPFVLATGMATAHLPDAFRSGVILSKPYLTAELNAALARAQVGDSVAG